MIQDKVLKGLVAGFLGGLAATYAKTIWEEHFPVRSEDTPSPPALMAGAAHKRLHGEDLSEAEKQTAESAIHWSFGTGTGVGYGVLAEAVPEVTVGMGLPFASLFYLGTHGSVVPALGLEPWPTEVSPRQYAVNELAGHAVYGVVLEVVRRGVRSSL